MKGISHQLALDLTPRELVSKLTLRYLNVRLMSKTTDTRTAGSGRVPIALGRRLFQIAHAAAAEAHAAVGLTPFEFGVLIQLHDSPGIDQNTLAERLAMDRTTTSALVYQLEQKKLIERAVDPGDRRARVLRLAPAGFALHTPVSGRTSSTRRAPSQSPARAATTERTCS